MIKANSGHDAVRLATALHEIGHGGEEIVILARDLVLLVKMARQDGRADAERARGEEGGDPDGDGHDSGAHGSGAGSNAGADGGDVRGADPDGDEEG